MRPGKLYIKIFLSFVAVLIVAEILIFGLFMAAVGRPMRDRVAHYTAAKAALLGTVVEEKLRSGPEDAAENDELLTFLQDFAGILEARIWLTGADGHTLLKTFAGAVPADAPPIEPMEGLGEGLEGIRMHMGRKHAGEYYVTLPVAMREGAAGTLHVLSPEHGPPHPEKGFGVGLLVIGGVIALLVVPVSRFITKRIKALKESAVHIAEGDLAHRAAVGGKDEIGDLGRAFNTMAAKLEQMIEGMRELTANVSHELRSPLARIRVSQELLRDRLDRGDVEGTRRPLESIQEEIELLDALIGRILELSRLERRNAPLETEEVDLAALVRELSERFEPAMRDKGLEPAIRLDRSPVVQGDADALRTAVSNLLDNALKHAPEGGRVRITLHSEGGLATLTVANACEDISEGDLAQLFEPFHRGPRARGPGSGLGLAITKRIVEQHGGTVEARRTDDGLAFALCLPHG